jgi:predicted metal-binding membrane protein
LRPVISLPGPASRWQQPCSNGRSSERPCWIRGWRSSNLLGAILLIAAGLYQWTPLKNVCLAQCQTPFGFLMRHGGFRDHPRGCLLLGLRHGGYCIGCCWVLMTLLFVGGVMNVLWIALLALLVLLEKLAPAGRWIARAAGIACVAAGAWLLLSLPR